MNHYTEEEFTSLITRFEKRELPKVEWTHEAHLAVAIWYCSHYPFKEAMPLVRTNISAHNVSTGGENTDTDGYHESITKSWLIVAADFIAKTNSNSLIEICNAFIGSEKGKNDYLLNFYSKECLYSTNARLNWVEPDLNPLPQLLDQFQ